jgi:hypothetical protein
MPGNKSHRSRRRGLVTNGLICLSLLAGFTAGAQIIQTDTLAGGSILVYQDARLDLLIKKQADYNEKMNLTRKFSTGFRIQVVNTTDRTEAVTAKTKLLQQFPEEKVYLLYQEPYFKVRFGNFRSRSDAEQYQQQLDKLFPGVFIIPSPIEPKPEWFKEAADGQM